MPYLYTGKAGSKEARPSYLKLASRISGLGFRMNAALKGPQTKTFTANCYLYPRTSKANVTGSAIYTPVYGYRVEATYDENLVVTVAIYQGIVTSGPVVLQKFYRYNPTIGTYTNIGDIAQATCAAYDYSAPLNTPFSYRIDGYNTAGELVQSVSSSSVTISGYDNWYIIRGETSSDLIQLDVTDSSSTIILQSEDFQPLASKYKTVQKGEVIGRRGTIEIVIENDDRGFTFSTLRELADYLGQVYLKSPFGDVYAIDIGAMQVEYVNNGHLKVRMPFIENDVA